MISINLQLFACGTCDGTCWGCTGCGTDCSSGCGYGCGSGCAITCTGGCNGCNGCSSCSSCTGCSSCSSCTGSCDGCNGCSSCSGTCSGDCNNACLSSEASTTIANLGSNIVAGSIPKVNDFKSLRDAIHGELSRRGRTIPADTYSVEPAVNMKVLLEHAQKIYTDINVIDTSKFKTMTSTTLTKASTHTDAISYIKTLMSQNIK